MEIDSIKNLPYLERPREKALHFGIEKLSNIELLALVIGSGGRNNNVLNVATSLIKKADGINNILSLTYKEYISIKGVKRATALRFLALNEILKRKGLSQNENIFYSSKIIAEKYRYIIGSNKQEFMYLLLLNNLKKIILEKELYIGTDSNFDSDINQILSEVIKAKAKFFVMIHNHPSNQITPSKADIISTNRIVNETKKYGLILIDHIIVGKGDEYFSFKDNDLLLY